MKIQDTQNLVVFFVLMRTNSLSKTTELLQLHRTTIKRSIEKLEALLEVELIDFKNGQIIPSVQAQELCQNNANLIDAYFHLICDDEKNNPSEMLDQVAVMAPIATFNKFLPYFISKHRLEDYGIQMKAVSYNIRDLYDKPELMREELLKSDILCIPSDFPLGALSSEFRVAKKMPMPLILVTTKTYLKQHNITRENYFEHIKCMMTDLMQQTDIAHHDLNKAHPNLLVENSAAVLEYILVNGTVSFCSTHVVLEHIVKGDMVQILPEISIARELILIYRYNRHPKVRVISNDIAAAVDAYYDSVDSEDKR